MRLWLTIVALVLAPKGMLAQEPSSATAPGDALANLISSNNLQGKDKAAFHLRMSFQVYDLKGRPDEKGTLDQWWAGPEGFHLDINAPSFGTVHNVRLGGLPNDTARRTLFLVKELLDVVRQPGVSLAQGKGELLTQERTLGQVVLQCTRRELTRPGAPPFNLATVCADQDGYIRWLESPGRTVLRNKVGRFAGTKVALVNEIRYNDLTAIQGQVETLQTFDLAHAGVELQKPAHAGSQDGSGEKPTSVQLAGGALAGKLVHKESPVYPESARSGRITGTVLLGAEITEKGVVADLFPIASPDRALTGAAIDAVKKWTYEPYMLNGSPTRVDTTITVNFNLNGVP